MKRLSIAAGLVCLLACAAPARAQSVAPPADSIDGGLKIPLLVWGSAVAADQTTTYAFSSRDGDLLHERNPLIRGLDGHPVWLVAAGASIDAASAWAAYELLGRRHPRWMKVALYSAAAYRSYLAIYNVRMMREAQAIRTQPAF